MNSTMGRPKVDEDARLDAKITIRITRATLEKLNRLAEVNDAKVADMARELFAQGLRSRGFGDG